MFFFLIIILNPICFMYQVNVLLLRCILSLLRAILKMFVHPRSIAKHTFGESEKAENMSHLLQFQYGHFHSMSCICLGNNFCKGYHRESGDNGDTNLKRMGVGMPLWCSSRSANSLLSRMTKAYCKRQGF